MNTAINLTIENLDLQYFIDNANANNFDELRDYITEENGFNVEMIYYGSCMQYLMENDSSLQQSLQLASDMGFSTENLTSEILASLLASENLRNEFDKYEDEINEYYDSLLEFDEDEEEILNSDSETFYICSPNKKSKEDILKEYFELGYEIRVFNCNFDGHGSLINYKSQIVDYSGGSILEIGVKIGSQWVFDNIPEL